MNQDSMYAESDLFVVCDGLGSPAGGEVASSLAVRAMAAHPTASIADLLAAVNQANEDVRARAAEVVALKGMGTTLCAIAIVQTDLGHQFGLVNVGDSRVYRFRDGRLEQLTDDHSRVAEMVRNGVITEAEAATHPQRNILTRAVGVSPSVEADHWILNITGGEKYMLCSDGICNEVPDSEIAYILEVNAAAPDAASALVRTANERGGKDNSTALVVNVDIVAAKAARTSGADGAAGGGAGDEGSASDGASDGAGDGDELSEQSQSRRGWFRAKR